MAGQYERGAASRPERHRPSPARLGEVSRDDRDGALEVDVLDPQTGELAAPDPGVSEEGDDRVVAPVVERAPSAGGQKRRDGRAVEDGRRFFSILAIP
jgi:hypothetical protein